MFCYLVVSSFVDGWCSRQLIARAHCWLFCFYCNDGLAPMSVDSLSAVLPLAKRETTKHIYVGVGPTDSTQEYDVVDIDGSSTLDLLRRKSSRSCRLSNSDDRVSGSSGRATPEAASTANGVIPGGGSRVRGRVTPEAARGSAPVTSEVSSVRLPLTSTPSVG